MGALNPGSFALVMGTGIVSVGLLGHGMSPPGSRCGMRRRCGASSSRSAGTGGRALGSADHLPIVAVIGENEV